MNNKKTAKILLAILLIITFSKEGYAGYKETGNFWFFIIITSLSIIASGFLIRSALKPTLGLQIENKYNNYFWRFILIFSVMALLGIVFGPNSPPPKPKLTIAIKGITISLDACMVGTKEMIPTEIQRKEYCICLAEKLTNYEDEAVKSKSLLEEGAFVSIINDIKEKGKISELGIEKCFIPSENMEWTDNLKKNAKAAIIEELRANGSDSTNDIDKYCNCLLDKFYAKPANEVFSENFSKTKEFLMLDSTCKEKSKLINKK